MIGQILLVENDPIITQVTRDLLKFDGHTVISASNGSEGLELFSAGQFDVIITDVKMPGIGGIDLLRTIKASDPMVEVIVFTAFASLDLAIEVMRNGGYDFLQKPEDISHRLRGTVTRALEKRQLNLKNQDLVDSLQQQILKKTNETRRLQTQHQITSILAECHTIADAAPGILITLLRNTGWTYGAIWAPERFSEELRCIEILARKSPQDPFVVNRKNQICRKGEDLPGLVWAQKRTIIGNEVHFTDLPESETLQRIGFPVLHGDKALGVIEFFHSEIRPPDENMAHMMTAIGSQLGLFMEREQLEQQFRQSQKFEAIGRLAGGIAHDFNNLLTSIMGYAYLMERQLDKPIAMRKNVQQIHKTGQRAAALIQQLLTMSRNQMVKLELVDLNQALEETHPMVNRLVGEHIEMTLSLFPNMDLILIDRSQIEQVIVNLAVNARDAMPGGGSLKLSTSIVRLSDQEAEWRHVSPGKYVRLTVTDTGHGMDERVKTHLFEPFFTTKEKGKGSGLGLATVYGIITQSNGYIEVDSEVGQGTTFSLYLPAATTAPQTQKTEFNPGFHPAEDWLRGTETVLVVENEKDIRDIMRQCLTDAGYTVMVAVNGEDALKCVEEIQGHLNLIITDMVMPRMSGQSFIEQILLRYAKIKVLLMSGTYDEHTTKNMSLYYHEFPFLPKPFTPEDLLRQIRSALDMPQFDITPDTD